MKGFAKDVAGKAQKKAGELTGSDKHQAEGLAKQGEGKVQKGYGEVKKSVNEKLKGS